MEKRHGEVEETLKVSALPRRISAGSVAGKRWNGNGITKDLVSPSNVSREQGEGDRCQFETAGTDSFYLNHRERDAIYCGRQDNEIAQRNVTRTAVNLVFPASTTKRMARFLKYIDTTLNRSDVRRFCTFFLVEIFRRYTECIF